MSFQRATASKLACIDGTRSSVKGQLVSISTGCQAVDALCGGGLPLGSLVLIEHDVPTYSQYLLKYFLAEGVLHRHAIFVAGPDDPDLLIDALPAVAKQTEAEVPSGSGVNRQSQGDRMNIAWRYESLTNVQSEVGSSKTTTRFDLSGKIDATALAETPLYRWPLTDDDIDYEHLYRRLVDVVASGSYSMDSKGGDTKSNVLRIALDDIGSPVFGNEMALRKFVLRLRWLLQDCYGCCFMTVRRSALTDITLNRLRRNCDVVFGVQTLSKKQREDVPMYKDYHGLFYVKQLPRQNCVTFHCVPDSLDLAFKLSRYKFSIEILHLPPMAGEEDVPKKSKLSPGGDLKSAVNLDF